MTAEQDKLDDSKPELAEAANAEKSPPPDKLVAYQPKALAKLAQGTSVVVATLLTLPDAFALWPNSPGPLSWLLSLIAVWLSALVLWFAGYFCLMHLVAWLTKGIALKDEGIRLWRFGQLIEWSTIKAVDIEPQLLFSRVFSLKPAARRLTLYIERKPGAHLAPQAIPSFLFTSEQFDNLVRAISYGAFGFAPDSQAVLLADCRDFPRLKTLYGILSWLRIFVSAMIAVGLISFLGRKATVNYFYNSANRSFRTGDLIKAKRDYELVTSNDPFFAVAWQNLGGTEFRLGDVEAARRCWLKALALKPDLVESKVSLSFIYLQERQFDKARDLIEHALKLAPRNIAALTNLADLQMRLGHTRDAMKTARFVLTIDRTNSLATCLIAQGRLRMGKAKEALALLAAEKDGRVPVENEVFCRLIKGEAALELGREQEAESLFQSVLGELPANPEALVDVARLRIHWRKWQEAEDLLARAQAAAPFDPRPLLVSSELYLKQGNSREGAACLQRAIALPGQDPHSLAEAAQLSFTLGARDQARSLARRAFKMEPVTPEALSVLEKLAKQK